VHSKLLDMLARESSTDEAKRRLLRRVDAQVNRRILRVSVGTVALLVAWIAGSIAALAQRRVGVMVVVSCLAIPLIVALSDTVKTLTRYSRSLQEALPPMDVTTVPVGFDAPGRSLGRRRLVAFLRDFDGDLAREGERELSSQTLIERWLAELEVEFVIFANLYGESTLRGENVHVFSVAHERDWRHTVGQVLATADAAIIHIRRSTEGVHWEYSTLLAQNTPTLVLVPDHLRGSLAAPMDAQPNVAVLSYAFSTYGGGEQLISLLPDRVRSIVDRFLGPSMVLPIRMTSTAEIHWASRAEYQEVVRKSLNLG